MTMLHCRQYGARHALIARLPAQIKTAGGVNEQREKQRA
jgi:hypothetical protein